MNKLPKAILGTASYSVECNNPSKLSGILMSHFSDSVFDVYIRDDFSFTFSCYLYASKKILNSDILYGSEVSKTSESGVIPFLKNYKNRYGLILGSVLAVIIIFLQSFIVWDIRITGNNTVGDDEIKNTLENLGFSEGKFVFSEEIPELQNKFIVNDNRFSWIAINMSGTVAFVEVKERSLKDDNRGAPSMSGIVALKDCIIELPEVLSGTSLVQIGDTVNKGQMLISPVEYGKDGNEYITGAKGQVLAKTYEDFLVRVEYFSIVPSYTHKTKKELKYRFLGKEAEVSLPTFEKFEKYICTNEQTNLKLGEDGKLPIRKITKEKAEYFLSEQIITPETARKKAYEKMYEKITLELPDAEIISTAFSEAEENDSFILRCKVECIRNVAARND